MSVTPFLINASACFTPQSDGADSATKTLNFIVLAHSEKNSTKIWLLFEVKITSPSEINSFA